MRVDEFEFFQQPPSVVPDLPDSRLLMQSPFTAFRVLEMLNRIGDVGVFSLDTGSFEGAIEKLPCGPNEGMAEPVLLVSRLLADKGDVGIQRPLAQHGAGPALDHGRGGHDQPVERSQAFGRGFRGAFPGHGA